MDEKTGKFEKEFYEFLQTHCQNPAILKRNEARLQAILNQLLFLPSTAISEIYGRFQNTFFSISKPFTNTQNVINEFKSLAFKTAENITVRRKLTELSNEAATKRKKSADAHIKATLDAIRN